MLLLLRLHHSSSELLNPAQAIEACSFLAAAHYTTKAAPNPSAALPVAGAVGFNHLFVSPCCSHPPSYPPTAKQPKRPLLNTATGAAGIHHRRHHYQHHHQPLDNQAFSVSQQVKPPTHLAVWHIFCRLTKRPQRLLSLCALLRGLQAGIQHSTAATTQQQQRSKHTGT